MLNSICLTLMVFIDLLLLGFYCFIVEGCFMYFGVCVVWVVLLVALLVYGLDILLLFGFEVCVND